MQKYRFVIAVVLWYHSIHDQILEFRNTQYFCLLGIMVFNLLQIRENIQDTRKWN